MANRYMINIVIEERPSKELEGPRSLYVSFTYDPLLVGYIKTFAYSKRRYIAATKEWEIAASEKEKLEKYAEENNYQITRIENNDITKARTFDRKIYDYASGHEFKTKPYEHQIAAFNYALTVRRSILGDMPGLGKTLVALNVGTFLKKTRNFKHALVISGLNSIKWNWVTETELHTYEKARVIGQREHRDGTLYCGQRDAKIQDLQDALDGKISEYFLVINIEMLRDEEAVELLSKMCEKGLIGLTIADEVHKFKNPMSQQGKGFLKIKSEYQLAMSGTPLMNNPMDLYVPIAWLDRHDGMNYWQYLHRYAVYGGYKGHEIVGWNRLAELKTTLNTCMLRRDKKTVLKDLPQKVYINELLEMEYSQQHIYESVKQRVEREIGELPTAYANA